MRLSFTTGFGKRFLLFIVLLLGLSSQANAQAIYGYWAISEGVENPGTVWLTIYNNHPTESIVGFGVGASSEIVVNELFSPDSWDSFLAGPTWGWNSTEGGLYSLPGDQTFSAFFGGEWDDFFPSYNQAAMYWWVSGAPAEIGPGEVAGGVDNQADPFKYTYYYYGIDSPAVIRLGNGQVFTGETEQNNPFPGGAVPAPGAVLLGSIGAGIVGWLRRRRAI